MATIKPRSGSHGDYSAPSTEYLAGALDFSQVQNEVKARAQHMLGQDAMPYDGKVSIGDRISCFVENCVATYDNAFFYMLFIMSAIFVCLFGTLWREVQDDEWKEEWTVRHGMFQAFQVLATGGIDDEIKERWPVIIYCLMCFFGIVVFALLVGMITESFAGIADKFNEGRTQFTGRDHTLIVGWNESTVRLICELAFIRRQWRVQNETCFRRLFWCARVKPSTPVAKGSIVIMCNTKEKPEMQQEILAAFQENGINPKRTRVGWDVICRIGDPTNVADLQRVGAHRAMAIIIQMTEEDRLEEEAQEGTVQNGATLRSLLAVRTALFSCHAMTNLLDLRIVVQLASSSKAIEAATFKDPNGRQVVYLQDLSVFLNSMMFLCATQQGLAEVLMDLIGFDGMAIRLRKVDTFTDKGRHLIGKTVQEAAVAWEDGIILGVIQSRSSPLCDLDPTLGIAPTAERPIQSTDRVIFVSDSSMPIPSKVADDLEIPAPTAICSETETAPENMLVSGWRKEWDEPRRFGMRLNSINEDCNAGSWICFMNMKKFEDFKELMDRVSILANGEVTYDEKKKEWQWFGRMFISHCYGDAAVFDDLQTHLLANRLRPFSEAVIISTMADKKLSPISRDTRVMNIMLLLRYIIADAGLPGIHIVGENALDSTTSLALAPPGLHDGLDTPDFVNIHAVIARALCSTLAYPRMYYALSQLFSNMPGYPCIVFKDAGTAVPLQTTLLFAQIIKAAQKAKPNDVCIGLRRKCGFIELAPRLSSQWVCEKGDKLVIVTRTCGHPRGIWDDPVTPSMSRASALQQQAPVVHGSGKALPVPSPVPSAVPVPSQKAPTVELDPPGIPGTTPLEEAERPAHVLASGAWSAAAQPRGVPS